MRSAILVFFASIAISTAQVLYHQDFQSGTWPADIIRLDVDKGGGYASFADTSWYINHLASDLNNYCAWSTGYTTSSMPTPADNWMILPALSIPPKSTLTYRTARTSRWL